MGLRLAAGVDLETLSARFGIGEVSLIDPDKRQLYSQLGLIEHVNERLRVTAKGMPLLDALLGELVSSELVLA